MTATPPKPSYPPAPWQLRGVSLQVIRWIDVAVARRFVPATAKVFTILPGKTVAVVYCARYEQGSSLIYSELALAPALIRAGGRTGFWISHIYVDDPHSIAGGHAIWHLPKQNASFGWSADDAQITVSQGALTLFAAELRARPGNSTVRDRSRAGISLPLLAPVIVENAHRFQKLWIKGRCQLARSAGKISADPASPISSLCFTEEAHLWIAHRLSLTIPAPHC